MFGNCVLVPATYYSMKEKYEDSPCNHCFYKQFGCQNKQAFTIGYDKFIPIENNPKELPKCEIWCKQCKGKTAKIQHEMIWNGHRAYAIRCPICGSEFALYKTKVHAEYTGFINGLGEYVSPDQYSKRIANFIAESNRRIPDTPPETVASFGQQDHTTIMAEALKKAGVI